MQIWVCMVGQETQFGEVQRFQMESQRLARSLTSQMIRVEVLVFNTLEVFFDYGHTGYDIESYSFWRDLDVQNMKPAIV